MAYIHRENEAYDNPLASSGIYTVGNLGTGEERGFVHWPRGGISRTISATEYKDPKKILVIRRKDG